MTKEMERLLAAAKEVVDAVSFDVNGAMIGNTWMGGNGGLVSLSTIAKTDALRRAISAATKTDEEESK